MSEFLPVKSIYTGADVTALGEAASDDVMLAPGGGIKYPDGSIQITAGGAGSQGPAGPEGPQGIQGEPGPAGADGAPGPKGDKGDAGPAGPQGEAGPAGADGAVGPVGPKGDKGDTGPQGEVGLQGPAGADGAPGPKGDTGDTGPAGPAGADSTVPGPKGDPGDPGPAGADGAQGPKGDPGDTGPAGPKGDQGEAGPAGAKGDTGPPGADSTVAGPQGPKGDAGPAGPDGAPGPKGDTGPAGADGIQGPAGADGAPGAQGIQGEVGPTGPAGADGAVGPAGPKGDTGDTGPAGPKGDTGDTGPAGPAPDVSQFVKKAGDTMTGALAVNSNLSYTGTLTGGTGVVAMGGSQFYKGADGRIGIGTTAPTTDYILDVAGNLRTTGSIRTKGTIRALGGSKTYPSIQVGEDADTGLYLAGVNTLAIATFGENRAVFDEPGNVMFGALSGSGTDYGAKFLVDGVSRVLYVDRQAGDGNVAVFRRGGTQVGRISVTATATTYVTTSDYRLKENPQPMTGALAKVAALKPCTYTWKTDGSAGQGFIAHELQAVMPECVVGAKDGVEMVEEYDAEGKSLGQKEAPLYQGIDTSFLVATLVAAIQEQQAIITQLQADVAALKSV